MRMQKQFVDKDLYRVFELSIIFKGIFALLELTGGFGALFVSSTYILRMVTALTQEELSTDAKDFFARYLLTSAQHFSLSSQHFVAYYLIIHGGVKLFLVGGLMMNKRWSYPLAIAVFGGFIIYQIFRFTLTHSLWLLVLTVFDIFVIWLIWHEYKRKDLTHGFDIE